MQNIKPFLKKFVLVNALSVILVLLYFLMRILFQEDKAVKLKSFDVEAINNKIEKSKNIQLNEEENGSKTEFMLLPR